MDSGSDKSTLAKRIAAARKTKGWNQTELAKAVGVTRAAVSYWESGGTKTLKSEYLLKLAEATDTNIRWLSSGDGTPMRRFIADDEEAELVDIYRDLQPATKRHPFKTAPALPKAK